MAEPRSGIRPLIAGNWKMNGLKAQLEEAVKLVDALAAGEVAENADVMVCPPATLLMAMFGLANGTRLQIGGQDCHPSASGAHTGDIAAEMIADAGGRAVIVGHSERRSDHGETSLAVRAKAEAAHRAGLSAIVCVGETAGERAAGLTLEVINRQLLASMPAASTADNTIIAYEPVWAIGTGLTPTVAEVGEVHTFIRTALERRFREEGARMRALYGGSVKPSNARELLAVPNVDGALVGGASLKAADFLGILGAYQQA